MRFAEGGDSPKKGEPDKKPGEPSPSPSPATPPPPPEPNPREIPDLPNIIRAFLVSNPALRAYDVPGLAPLGPGEEAIRERLTLLVAGAKGTDKRLVTRESARRIALNGRLLNDFGEIRERLRSVTAQLSIERRTLAPGRRGPAQPAKLPRVTESVSHLIQLKLRDLTPGWRGTQLRAEDYTSPTGIERVRIVVDGPLRTRRLTQETTLFDKPLEDTTADEIHSALRGVVRSWYQSHRDKRPEEFSAFLGEQADRLQP